MGVLEYVQKRKDGQGDCWSVSREVGEDPEPATRRVWRNRVKSENKKEEASPTLKCYP